MASSFFLLLLTVSSVLWTLEAAAGTAVTDDNGDDNDDVLRAMSQRLLHLERELAEQKEQWQKERGEWREERKRWEEERELSLQRDREREEAWRLEKEELRQAVQEWAAFKQRDLDLDDQQDQDDTGNDSPSQRERRLLGSSTLSSVYTFTQSGFNRLRDRVESISKIVTFLQSDVARYIGKLLDLTNDDTMFKRNVNTLRLTDNLLVRRLSDVMGRFGDMTGNLEALESKLNRRMGIIAAVTAASLLNSNLKMKKQESTLRSEIVAQNDNYDLRLQEVNNTVESLNSNFNTALDGLTSQFQSAMAGFGTQIQNTLDAATFVLGGQIASDIRQQVDVKFVSLESDVNATFGDLQVMVSDQILQNGPQSTFTRWGHSACPASAELVYSGYVGGDQESEAGASTSVLCLPQSPALSDLARPSRAASLHGASYATGANVDQDAVCAVCRTASATTLMLPAADACQSGWSLQYSGLLMGSYPKADSGHDYVCVDSAMEFRAGGEGTDSNMPLYPTFVTCGSLPCAAYTSNKAVPCVVCSK